MITSCVELITPNIAERYLEMQDQEYKNRNLRYRVVSAYARDMREGRWALTHQGIAFDENGFLRDGQHRLHAIIEAKVPIEMAVTRGIPAGSYACIDEGVKRSFNDAMNFCKEYHDDVVIRQTSTTSTIRALVRNGYDSNIQLTVGEVTKVYDAFKDSVNAIYRCSITRNGKKNANISAAGLAALICGEPEKDIFNFFSCFYQADISDCDSMNVSAAILWSKQISDAAIKHITMDRKRLYNGTQNAIWNFCNAEHSKQIKFVKNERYPVNKAISYVLSGQDK